MRIYFGGSGDYGNYNEYRNSVKKFSLVNTIIIVLNVLAFIVVEVSGSSYDTMHMLKCGASYWPLIVLEKQYWRLFTCAFLHFGAEHIFGNLVVLLFIGDNLERALGKIKYILFYVICILGSSAASCYMEMLCAENTVSAGASGAIFGVAGGILYVLIANKGHLEDLSALQVGVFIVYTLYSGLTSSNVDNIAHLAGLIIGFILAMILYRKKKQNTVEKIYIL